jgi:hypothetical protein
LSLLATAPAAAADNPLADHVRDAMNPVVSCERVHSMK